MKFVSRENTAPPSAFAEPGAQEARQKLLELFDQDELKLYQSRPESEFGSRSLLGSSQVASALLDLFEGCCAFCETKINHALAHRFRPPQNAQPTQNSNVSQLYYAWLAEAWQNLYLICEECVPEEGTFFPLNGRRVALPSREIVKRFVERNDGLWPDYPIDERPVLLDPCVDRQIWRSLYFRSTGEVVGISRRGRQTIRHFKLDRSDLRFSRREAIQAAIEKTELRISDGSLDGTNKSTGHAGACQWFLREALFEALGRRGLRDQSRQIAALARLDDGLDRFRSAVEAVDQRVFDDELATDALDPVARPQIPSSFLIENFKSLEKLKIKLPPAETSTKTPALLILGENATGKSSILEAIALGLMQEQARKRIQIDVEGLVLDPKYLGAPEQEAPSEARILTTFKNGSTSKFALRRANGGATSKSGESVFVPIFAYGAYRQYLSGERKFAPHKHVRSLFQSDELLSNPEKWLLKLSSKEFIMVARALRQVVNMEASFEVLERNEKKVFVVSGAGQSDSGGSIKTPIELVSSGFRAVLAMLCDIMQGLMDKRINPNFETLDSARGIVLIDEVEAHLHPRWKLSIMTGLRRALPEITFIATSHDPLCLRGMYKGEVLVLERISGDQAATEFQIFTHGLMDLPDNENWTIEQLLTADFFQMRTTESLDAERRAAEMEDRLARGKKPADDRELAAYLSEITEDLPIGHTEVHRLVQEAIARFLRERRQANDAKLKKLRDDIRQSIIDALRVVG